MRLADFDYVLPDELIARYPTDRRRDSRLLDVAGGCVDRGFAELPTLLRAGDLLVFNDTRVVPARLRGCKEGSGGRVEMLLERQTGDAEALVQLRASKTPKPGQRIVFGTHGSAEVLGRNGPFFELQFSLPLERLLAAAGEIPLPPYLGRDAEAADDERYQTVYARRPGAVAAPTAGLHFDDEMLAETRRIGVDHAWLTLHVGAGTFQPLRDEQLLADRLHGERLRVDSGCCEQVAETRRRGGRVVAVGTTVVRALEAAAAGGELQPLDTETNLLIRPGHAFRVVDNLLTNFHLPRSSLLLLVAAFSGVETVMAAYRHAVDARYRFYSYGDAMWLARAAE